MRCCLHFFFNDTATTEIYTLSLHDALPISATGRACLATARCGGCISASATSTTRSQNRRSEEHTSELQSRPQLVCRLLLEKKKHGHANVFELVAVLSVFTIKPPATCHYFDY